MVKKKPTDFYISRFKLSLKFFNNISDEQLKYVTGARAGAGLIFYGDIILPFEDVFPKDLELYRIMTTKLEEVKEAEDGGKKQS